MTTWKSLKIKILKIKEKAAKEVSNFHVLRKILSPNKREISNTQDSVRNMDIAL